VRESAAVSALRGRECSRGVIVDDEGAGTVTGLTVIATLIMVASLMLPFAGLMLVQVRAQAVSDQAALSAANAMTGALVGQPCALAADIVASMRTSAWSCDLFEGDAYVTLRVPFGPVHVDVRSRAGLPE